MIIGRINHLLYTGMPVLWEVPEEHVSLEMPEEFKEFSLITANHSQVSVEKYNTFYSGQVYFGMYEKKTEEDQFVLPIVKIGENRHALIYELPYHIIKEFPVFSANFLTSKFLILALAEYDEHIEGETTNVPTITCLRSLVLPDDLQIALGEYFVHSQNGGVQWTLKYVNWLREVLEKNLSEVLDHTRWFGPFKG